MSQLPLHSPDYRRDLGGGLVLRWSTAADVEQISALYGHVFRQSADDPPNQQLQLWTQDLMSGRHPLIAPGDFALVEDTDRGICVAATCLLSQTWEYAGIPFPVGRPEIVASHPDYRNRGLVRAVFELIHARSATLGHMAQGITGIPYYYRQFGYEYALDLEGSRSVFFAINPPLKPGDAEPYTLRDATPDDLPHLMAWYDHDRSRTTISTQIDADFWRWVMQGQNPATPQNWYIQMICDAQGSACGYLLIQQQRWGPVLIVGGLGVAPGTSLAAVLPSVLRGVAAQAERIPGSKPDTPSPNRTGFVLGRQHPVYDLLGSSLSSRINPPYAWYVRVPDLPAFIRHIAPALERRLAASDMVGYSGELRLDFYRAGLRLVFDKGCLSSSEHWRADSGWGPRGQAGFPPLVFLQLLFGHRSLDELCHAFPDVWAEDEVRPLLLALFPPQPSWVLPLN